MVQAEDNRWTGSIPCLLADDIASGETKEDALKALQGEAQKHLEGFKSDRHAVLMGVKGEIMVFPNSEDVPKAKIVSTLGPEYVTVTV